MIFFRFNIEYEFQAIDHTILLIYNVIKHIKYKFSKKHIIFIIWVFSIHWQRDFINSDFLKKFYDFYRKNLKFDKIMMIFEGDLVRHKKLEKNEKKVKLFLRVNVVSVLLFAAGNFQLFCRFF